MTYFHIKVFTLAVAHQSTLHSSAASPGPLSRVTTLYLAVSSPKKKGASSCVLFLDATSGTTFKPVAPVTNLFVLRRYFYKQQPAAWFQIVTAILPGFSLR